MGISATGLGSGLDVEGIVSSLVLADVQPAEKRLNLNEAKYQAQLSAYGTIKSALGVFQSASNTVGTASNYQRKTATSSSESDLIVNAQSGAAIGSYDVEVSALASKQSLVTAAFGTTSDVVGTGDLLIEVGTTVYNSGTDTYTSFTPKAGIAPVTITIDSTNNTLAGVKEAINAAGAGVEAAIVNDGSGYRLVLTSTSTGLENGFALTVTDPSDPDPSTGLSQLNFNNIDTQMTQTKAASDAALTINGLAVTSASNKVATALDDVTLNLQKVTVAPVTINVQKDIKSAKDSIVAFVEAFNDVIGTFNQLTKYDPNTATGSLLNGDSTIRSLTSKIRNLVNTQVENVGGGFSSMAELGITTVVKDGKLSIDTVKLDAALNANPLDVGNVFAAIGRPSSSNVRFLSSTSSTLSGSYAVAATVTSAPGVYTAGAPIATDNFQGGNDAGFSVVVDNGAAQTVVINSNFASFEEVRAAIEGQLTGVAVTLNASDQLIFTSNSLGPSSSISISALTGTAASSLSLTAGSGTAGTTTTDYTINGEAAIFDADNNIISGAAGTAVSGLSLEILGGATGDLGTVDFGIGIGSQLNTLVEQLLADEGLLDARVDGLNASIADLTTQRLALNAKAAVLESRYRAQFNGLETIIASLTTTQNFLTTALSQFVDPLAFKK